MAPTLSFAEYQAFVRNDLYTFTERAFRELNPQTPFFRNWHLELVAAKLEACMRGEITRLIVNVPPRSLKSHSAAVALPAFILGHDPTAQIIAVSYAQNLADKHSLDCRTLMATEWYRSIFPTRLSSQKQSVQEFMTTRGGFRLATSTGGVLTGRGADYIIVDDPCQPDQAVSDTQRNSVNTWFSSTLYSRLNNKKTGRILIIMQRLHADDLVGHVLEQEQWAHLKLSAIAQEDESHLIQSRYQRKIVRRNAGDALQPEREPLPVLSHLRKTIGEYNFAGQYLQEPAPLGGGLVKKEWFKSYVPGDEPRNFDLIFQSWDSANKCTELSDYSVCTTWGLKNKNLYLLHVLRERLGYPGLKRTVRDQALRFKPANIVIEDKASGTPLIQELIADRVHGVTRYSPTMDKIMRLHSVTSTIENGLVYLPTEASWLAIYLQELTTFPNSKFDDQADSTSQALDWVKAHRPYQSGVLEYYRVETMKLKLKLSPDYDLIEYEDPENLIAKHRQTGKRIQWKNGGWISCPD